MRVYPPSHNKINQGFSASHRGYDHDDVPDNRVFASFDGVVEKTVNIFAKSWIANTPSDPWYVPGVTRKLKTEDLGNFVKIKGAELFQISGHLKKDSLAVIVGQQIKAGDLIGLAGDNNTDTGNSSGGHTHNEYRTLTNKPVPVEFSTETLKDSMADKIYTEAEMTDMRLQRDENWTLYQEEKKRAEKAASESTQLATLKERLKSIEATHEQELTLLKQHHQQELKDETLKLRSTITTMVDEISTLRAQLLSGQSEWKSRFTSRKWLLAVSTALFDVGVALAILAGVKPDPIALAQALTAIHTAVGLFAIPEALSDHQQRMALTK